MKQGSQTTFPSHRSIFEKSEILQFTCLSRRTLAEAKSVLNECKLTANRDIMWNISLICNHSVVLVLSSFYFVHIHPSADIYWVFEYDSMSVLSLEICKQLTGCLVAPLEGFGKTTSVLEIKSGFCIVFESSRQPVLHFLDRFLKNVSCASPGFGRSFGLGFGNGIFEEIDSFPINISQKCWRRKT